MRAFASDPSAVRSDRVSRTCGNPEPSESELDALESAITPERTRKQPEIYTLAPKGHPDVTPAIRDPRVLRLETARPSSPDFFGANF